MYTEYTGKRHEENLINERENFFHKPQVALNHYFDIPPKKAMEYTLVFCIPIAIWMATKINERWHDDRED